DRDDVVPPTVDDICGAIENPWPQFRETFHVESGRHQEHTSGMQKRGRCYCNVTAHARPDEYEITGELLAEVDELRNAAPGLVDASIVHRMGLIALTPRNLCQRSNLPSPRAALLAMGKDDVPIDYGRFHGLTTHDTRRRSRQKSRTSCASPGPGLTLAGQ